MNLIQIIEAQGLGLRELTARYAEFCWSQGWKPGMEKKLADPSNPFCGGPGDLLDAGVTVLDGLDRPIPITALTRVKLKQLSDSGLATVERVYGKSLAGVDRAKHANSDVLHQEFVGDFATNVANSDKHFLNNAVSAAAVLDYLFAVEFVRLHSLESGVELLDRILNEDLWTAQLRAALTRASRSAWIGRACQDRSWKESGDFVFQPLLDEKAAQLDVYTVVPVLRYLRSDLATSFGTVAH